MTKRPGEPLEKKAKKYAKTLFFITKSLLQTCSKKNL